MEATPDPAQLEQEKAELARDVRETLRLWLPAFLTVALAASCLSSRYLDRHISITESLIVMMPLLVVEIGGKLRRIAKIRRVLSG